MRASSRVRDDGEIRATTSESGKVLVQSTCGFECVDTLFQNIDTLRVKSSRSQEPRDARAFQKHTHPLHRVAGRRAKCIWPSCDKSFSHAATARNTVASCGSSSKLTCLLSCVDSGSPLTLVSLLVSAQAGPSPHSWWFLFLIFMSFAVPRCSDCWNLSE